MPCARRRRLRVVSEAPARRLNAPARPPALPARSRPSSSSSSRTCSAPSTAPARATPSTASRPPSHSRARGWRSRVRGAAGGAPLPVQPRPSRLLARPSPTCLPTSRRLLPFHRLLRTADLLNFSQYKSVGDVNVSVSLPYRLAGARVRSPGWESVCATRSPSAPADCEGDACRVTINV